MSSVSTSGINIHSVLSLISKLLNYFNLGKRLFQKLKNMKTIFIIRISLIQNSYS